MEIRSSYFVDVTLRQYVDVYGLYSDTDQWRTQKCFSSGGGGYAWISFGAGLKNSVEDRRYRELGSWAVSLLARDSTQFTNE
jgi:hypothetical protein